MSAMSAPLSTPGSSEITSLDLLSDDELDALPFGVICLNKTATVARYNLGEARFARLDRSQVLGKPFFIRIAPCTATPAFQGRFEEILADVNAPPVRFEYVFDFRFGAQDVEVEMTRAAGDRVYITINRRRLLPPRAASSARTPGIAQAELSPREDLLGVIRDANQRRLVHATPVLFEALQSTLARLVPGRSEQAFDEWGFTWGRLAVVDMEAEAIELFERSLRELPMVTVAEFVTQYIARHGWGRASVDFSESARGAFVINLQRSVFADSPSGPSGRRCALFAGFFRAFFSHLANRKLAVRETRCGGAGDAGATGCELVVVGARRAESLDRAIVGGPRSVRELLARLEASDDAS